MLTFQRGTKYSSLMFQLRLVATLRRVWWWAQEVWHYIHMEEDAEKLMHSDDGSYSHDNTFPCVLAINNSTSSLYKLSMFVSFLQVDLTGAGVPLLYIVS